MTDRIASVAVLARALLHSTGFEEDRDDRTELSILQLTRDARVAMDCLAGCKAGFDDSLCEIARGHEIPMSSSCELRRGEVRASMDKIAQVTRKSAAPPGTVATAYKAILTALSACCLALAEYMFARCNDYAEDGAIGRVEQSNGSYLKIVYIKRYTVEEAQDPETLIEQLLSDEAPAPLGQWRQVVEVMTSDSPRKRRRPALPDFDFPRAMQSLVKSVHGVRYSLASEPMDTAAHGVVPDIGQQPCAFLTFFHFVLYLSSPVQMRTKSGAGWWRRAAKPPRWGVTALVLAVLCGLILRRREDREAPPPVPPVPAIEIQPPENFRGHGEVFPTSGHRDRLLKTSEVLLEQLHRYREGGSDEPHGTAASTASGGFDDVN